MKWHKIRKWIVIVLCGFFLFTITACGKKTDSESDENMEENEHDVSAENQNSGFGANSENASGIAYVSSDTPYFEVRQIESIYENKPNQTSYINSIAAGASNAAILMGIYDFSQNESVSAWVNYIILIVNDQGEVIQEIDLRDIVASYAEIIKVMADKNGNLILVARGFNDESSVGDGIVFFEIDVQSGSLIWSMELKYPEENRGAVYYSDILIDQNGLFIVRGRENLHTEAREFIRVFDENASFMFMIEEQIVRDSNESSWHFGDSLFTDGERVYTIVHPHRYGATRKDSSPVEEFDQYIRPIDVEAQMLGSDLQGFGSGMKEFNIQSGYDGLYYKDNDGIYRIHPASGAFESVFLWRDIDVDFLGDEVNTVVLSDEKILAFTSSHSEKMGEEPVYQWLLFEKQDSNPNSGKKILSIGVYGVNANPALMKAVYLFNQYSKDTHAEIFDYMSSNTIASLPEEQIEMMNQAILSGRATDVFIENGYDINHFEQYANRGLFVDLKEKIDEDDELIVTDFYENIFSASEKDGHIYYMFPHFFLYGYEGATSMIGDPKSWTIDELSGFSRNLPEGMSLFWNDTFYEDLFQRIMFTSSDRFVDWKEKKASYDTPEFQKLLEFVKDNAVNYEEVVDLQERGQWVSSSAMFEDIYYFSSRDFMHHDRMEPTTFINYPVMQEREFLCMPGVFVGIFNSSVQQEEAWTYIKYLFSEDLQDTFAEYSIPIRKSSLEKNLEAGKQEIIQIYEDMVQMGTAESVPADEDFGTGDFFKNNEDFFDQVNAKGEKFKMIISQVQGIYRLDREVWIIAEEESRAFFEDQRTSKETARIIQERVTKLFE